MHRREFLLGAGTLWLAGCSGSRAREWADVPWVEPSAAPSAAPPRLAAAAPPPTPRAPEAPCGPGALPTATGHVHVVEPGDTLASLARRSGCSVERLASVNRLASGAVRPGQTLWLPGVPAPTSPRCAPCAVPAGPAPGRDPGAGGAGWTLVRREQWGAGCLRANHDPMGAVTRITLHHTDEHAGMRGRPDADVVRAIQRYHQDQQGWADIGYHFLVGADGRVYEGRPAGAQGAHSGGANNRNNLGVSVIGNFSSCVPPSRQLAALAGFLEDRCAAYGVRRNGLLAHRDLAATECPGGALYGWLQQFKRA